MIENSCSLNFTDENITPNPTTLIFASSPTSSVVLVTTTPDFYHQHGKYQVICQTTYAPCRIENSVLTCQSPIEDKVAHYQLIKELNGIDVFMVFVLLVMKQKKKLQLKSIPSLHLKTALKSVI
jgi:hypothetical protein